MGVGLPHDSDSVGPGRGRGTGDFCKLSVYFNIRLAALFQTHWFVHCTISVTSIAQMSPSYPEANYQKD